MILASKSPRRQELIRLVQKDIMVIPSGMDESSIELEPADYLAERLARAKALDVAGRFPDELVIGCDTVVLLDDEVMGKPRDAGDAARMLGRLSGHTHRVITGTAMVQGKRIASFSEMTEVEFYPLSDGEIEAYIQTGEPFDKAGAYGIQGRGSLMVKGIRGDFFNVVGLPVARLKRELDFFMNRK